MIFEGVHSCVIDSKGRVSIPAAFRDNNQKTIRLLEHPNSPVLIVHAPQNNRELESLSVIFSRNTQPDTAGRIIIPQSMRGFLGLNRDGETVCFIGMGNHYQIWSQDNWKKVEPAYKKRLAEALLAASVWTPPQKGT